MTAVNHKVDVNDLLRNLNFYHTIEIQGIKTKGNYDYTGLIEEFGFPPLPAMESGARAGSPR